MTDYARMIPPEVVEAVRRSSKWFITEDTARAAIAAGLAAWPGKTSHEWDGNLILNLKLPLPQEPGDE